MRYGFPIDPDFGGTGHAYCSGNLNAAIEVLLGREHQPQQNDALRGNMIKNRVKSASKLLLAQPYNQHLIRQGVCPGPHLLLQDLQKSSKDRTSRLPGKEE